jgi:hypothetical protein
MSGSLTLILGRNSQQLASLSKRREKIASYNSASNSRALADEIRANVS